MRPVLTVTALLRIIAPAWDETTAPTGPEYFLRLIGEVISVSLETVEIVAGLPELGIDERVSDGEDES